MDKLGKNDLLMAELALDKDSESERVGIHFNIECRQAETYFYSSLNMLMKICIDVNTSMFARKR